MALLIPFVTTLDDGEVWFTGVKLSDICTGAGVLGGYAHGATNKASGVQGGYPIWIDHLGSGWLPSMSWKYRL